MDVNYFDVNLAKALISIRNRLIRYYTACMQSRNTSVQAVENTIDARLQHALESSFTEDTMNGGAHEVYYVKGIGNRNILFLDGTPIAGFNTIRNPQFLAKLGCPLAGTYDLSEEGNAVLEMINNFIGMSLNDFADKYYSLPPLENLDEFFGRLAKFVDHEKFEMSDDAVLEDPNFYMGGKLTFSGKELLFLPSFINSNSQRFGKNAAKIMGDTAYYEDKPVSSISLYFVVDHNKMDNFKVRNPSVLRVRTSNDTDVPISIEINIPNDSEFVKALRSEIYPWYFSMFVKYDSEDAEGRERERREFVEEIKKIIYVKDFSERMPQFNMGNSQGEGGSPQKTYRSYDFKLLLKSEQARLKGRFKVTDGRYKNYNTIIYSNRHGRLMVLFDEEEHGECFYFRSDKGDFTGGERFRACNYGPGITNIYDEPDVYVPEEFMEIAEDYAERDTIIKGIYYR